MPKFSVGSNQPLNLTQPAPIICGKFEVLNIKDASIIV